MNAIEMRELIETGRETGVEIAFNMIRQQKPFDDFSKAYEDTKNELERLKNLTHNQ